MCDLHLGAEPASSPCAMFFCGKYRAALTHAGCVARQDARRRGSGVHWGRSWPRYRFCATSCGQGREVRARLPGGGEG